MLSWLNWVKCIMWVLLLVVYNMLLCLIFRANHQLQIIVVLSLSLQPRANTMLCKFNANTRTISMITCAEREIVRPDDDDDDDVLECRHIKRSVAFAHCKYGASMQSMQLSGVSMSDRTYWDAGQDAFRNPHGN